MGDASGASLFNYMENGKRKRKPLIDSIEEGIMMLLGYISLCILLLVVSYHEALALTTSSYVGAILGMIYMIYTMWRGAPYYSRLMREIRVHKIQGMMGEVVVDTMYVSLGLLSVAILLASVCIPDVMGNKYVSTMGMIIGIVYMSYQIPVTLKQLLNSNVRNT